MKVSKYNMIWNLKNGITLAFNSTSCALAKIDEDFINIIENIDHINYNALEGKKKALVDDMLLGRYICGDDFDELKVLKYGHLSGKFDDDCLHLTIAPTLNCNFACTYCHKNISGGNMNKNVQNSIINWISEKAKNKKDISVVWSGGEPLLAKNIILDMSEKIITVCNENSSRYHASMVTNGYLLDDISISELKQSKINSVQITLDGPARIHNTRRVLKDSSNGTFDVILSNIIKFKENNMAITIRMNTDKADIDYIDEFLDILIQNDLRDIPVNFYCSAGIKGACISAAEACMNVDGYAKENLKYQQKLLQKGFNTSISANISGFYPGVRKNYCGADNVGTFILDAEGYMYKCLRDMGKSGKAVGNVLSIGNLTEKMYMRDIDYISWSPFEHEECLKCSLLPVCMGGCPNNALNNGYKPECNHWKHTLEEALNFTYFLSNPEDNDSPDNANAGSNFLCQNENISARSMNSNNQKTTEIEYNQEMSPKMIGWEITQRCNLTCPHCYTAAAAANQAVPEMSTDECCKLIEDFAHLGAEIIGWTGGEPLLRKDLEYLIAFAKASGIRSGITTNGLLLNENRAAKLKEAGLDFIQVSLDGSTPDRNARIRNCKESDFELVLNGIRNSLTMGIHTNMAMLLCAETLEDAPAYIELARQLKIDIVRFCGFVPAGRGKKTEITDRFLFSGVHLARLREFVVTALLQKDINILFDPAFGSLPPDHCFHSCNAGIGQLYLDTLGNVYPCTSMIDQRFLVGNIHKRSIDEIYKDERMRPSSSFSEASLKGLCSSCVHLSDCRGGCRGITLAHTGDIHSSFPYCLKQQQ